MSTVVLFAAMCCGQASLPKPLLEPTRRVYAIAWSNSQAALERGKSLAGLGLYRQSIICSMNRLNTLTAWPRRTLGAGKCDDHLGDQEGPLRLAARHPLRLHSRASSLVGRSEQQFGDWFP